MSNSIFDLNKKFDFEILNLGNPTLANNNNYISKISHGINNKNLYIQLPKCTTKQGIIKNSSKTYTELNFCISQKNVIDFFENLEKFCTEKIYNNRELWFYDSSNIQKNDIDELMLSTMKPYKHGKNFLIKSYIKLDKLNIYDENENKISHDDFNSSLEFIPLVNINNIKFSTKNFNVEIFLTQIMVILPSDEFEKQFLIKNDKNIKLNNNISEKLSNKINTNNEYSNTVASINNEDSNSIATINNEDSNSVATINNEDSNSLATINNEDSNSIANVDNKYSNSVANINNEESNSVTNINNADSNSIIGLNNIVKTELNNINESNIIKSKSLSSLVKDKDKSINNEFQYLINHDLETVNILDIPETKENIIDLKSHEEIYLEIYKTAKQKAKEIRKNAIAAFLEAKKIKIKYNLDKLDYESSDDEEDYLNS